MDDVLIVPSPPGRPTCCGQEPVCIGTGSAVNFDIAVVLCMICERSQTITRRTDGRNFWVGAMGRAIVKEQQRIIADFWGDESRQRPNE
jgi:hypothetical protein